MPADATNYPRIFDLIDTGDQAVQLAFTPRDSGYSGAEPISMALDAEGRLWIGTRTAGVDIYRLQGGE